MSLEQVARAWTELGDADPLWAVLTEADKRHGNWREREFLGTGENQVNADIAWAERVGVPVEGDRALDFGCGAGRLSNALAAHFHEVVAVDISAPMLERARALDRSGGRTHFVHNTAPHLGRFGDETFDFVYTDRVLQHLPPKVARRYLGELLRVTRPNGVLVVGVADRPAGAVRGALTALAPQPLLRAVQRHVLGFPAPMRMHAIRRDRFVRLAADGGGVVRATASHGSDAWWCHVRHLVVKASRHAPDRRVAR